MCVCVQECVSVMHMHAHMHKGAMCARVCLVCLCVCVTVYSVCSVQQCVQLYSWTELMSAH